jgi:hypothetical protein
MAAPTPDVGTSTATGDVTEKALQSHPAPATGSCLNRSRLLAHRFGRLHGSLNIRFRNSARFGTLSDTSSFPFRETLIAPASDQSHKRS